jgi:hypothetical protein
MGSALCFPLEAMVFLTIVCIGYADMLNRKLSSKDLEGLLPKVRVYGDDIIIPVEIVPYVVDALVRYGLVVNRKKSFWTGKFRESCGKDYYCGSDVSVTYIRRNLPTQRSNVQEMLSLIALRNRLYANGLWTTARAIDDIWRRLAPLPVVLPTSPILGRHSFLGFVQERFCPNLHIPLVKGYVVRAISPKYFISGHGALLKFFLKRGSDPVFDVKHLERYGRPDTVDIKIRWAPAY